MVCTYKYFCRQRLIIYSKRHVCPRSRETVHDSPITTPVWYSNWHMHNIILYKIQLTLCLFSITVKSSINVWTTAVSSLFHRRLTASSTAASNHLTTNRYTQNITISELQLIMLVATRQIYPINTISLHNVLFLNH